MGDARNKKNKATKVSDKATSKKRDDKAAKAARGTAAAIIAAARAAAFTDDTPAKAFAHFRPLAEQVETADLAVFTGQPLLLRANILTALDAASPHLDAAVNALREPKLEQVFELPALIMALDFAVGRVPIASLSAGEIEKMLAVPVGNGASAPVA